MNEKKKLECILSVLPVAAVTNSYKLGTLTKQKCIFLQFRSQKCNNNFTALKSSFWQGCALPEGSAKQMVP